MGEYNFAMLRPVENLLAKEELLLVGGPREHMMRGELLLATFSNAYIEGVVPRF